MTIQYEEKKWDSFRSALLWGGLLIGMALLVMQCNFEAPPPIEQQIDVQREEDAAAAGEGGD